MERPNRGNGTVVSAITTDGGESVYADQHSLDSGPYLDSRTNSNMELHTISNTGESTRNFTDISYSLREVENTNSASGHKRTCCSVRKSLEVLFLSVIVGILLAAYAIPTIYFVNPPLQFAPVSFKNRASLSPASMIQCTI